MKLSVIVPVYNIENYLEKCLSSIYNQDLDKKTYEIIAINDGSTDDCPAILERLSKKISNLVIIHQKNKGLSGARNSGFDAAKGNYILCVDSDDYILPNTLKTVYQIADNNKLDILEFSAQGVDENRKIMYHASNSTHNKILQGADYLASIQYMSSACNKLYRRDFLNNHILRFMEGVFIEDIEFNTRAVFVAKKIMATDFLVAHFLQRPGSITRDVNFDKKKKMIYDILRVIVSINNFAESQIGPNSVAFKPVKKRVSSLMSTVFLRVMKDCKSITVFKEIVLNLKKHQLYPAKYKAETKSKQLFLQFSNKYWLMYMVTAAITLKNKALY